MISERSLGISSGKDIQFENVFDFENFMHQEDSRGPEKLRHCSYEYLLNVSILSFREKTCGRAHWYKIEGEGLDQTWVKKAWDGSLIFIRGGLPFLGLAGNFF